MIARETIFALASGQGAAAIGIIRVSGPDAEQVLSDLTANKVPPLRRAAVRTLFDTDGTMLDEALVLRFGEGQGYTGEPAFELQCHGGRAVIRAVLGRLERFATCRLAEPGEFTWRAVEAGRMDLIDAEALGDLISAETELQRRQASRAMSGGLREMGEQWRERLLRAAALIEVTIDWVDEEVPEDVWPEVSGIVREVLEQISAELERSVRVERLRQGFEVALVGAPNVGKSSLLNALAGREAAISSEHAGTTRDVIEVRYDLDGLPLVFLDMAGIREAIDPVEVIGVRRARARAAEADVRLFLVDGNSDDADWTDLQRPGDMIVATKCDLGNAVSGDIAVSARTGQGLSGLLDRIRERLSIDLETMGLVGHERQRMCLSDARENLQEVVALIGEAEVEIVADALRRSIHELELLIGRVDVETVLGKVFSSFCLGK